MTGNIVKFVDKGSIADELGVKPGDVLLSINNQEIKDVFDYRMKILDNSFTLTFKLQDEGVVQTVEIEKDDDEILGLTFENDLMDECMACHNNCLFCFIAQLPKGMRDTLYFKDDDLRMSFLIGNYVTLTNLDDEEFTRLLSYGLSPINISVHATDSDLRIKLLRNKNAGKLLERLKQIADHNIEINCQFVLCPGINDGINLEKSLADLESIGDMIKSIAVVPVGLTKYREENNLFKLQKYNKDTATEVLNIVSKWQKHFFNKRGTRVIYAADEFYIRADMKLPEFEEYEDFPQLENGVGMIADFVFAMEESIKGRQNNPDFKFDGNGKNVWRITGTEASQYASKFDETISELYNIKFQTVPIVNDFWGHDITVTGLLTGNDIIKQIRDKVTKQGASVDLILLSDKMLKADDSVFLDDVTLEEFRDEMLKLGAEVALVTIDNSIFDILEDSSKQCL